MLRIQDPEVDMRALLSGEVPDGIPGLAPDLMMLTVAYGD
jgi:hypothetical protein